MNEEINKIFEQWKQFLSWCYENNDKTTEIHRDSLERVMAYTRQLENIIKEVSEILKEGLEQFDTRRREEIYAEQYFENALEILDKGE